MRNSVPQDAWGVQRVEASATTTLRQTYRPNQAALRLRQTTSQDMHRLVAEWDGAMVGTTQYIVDGQAMRIIGLGVHRDVRRQGVARALIAEVADRAASRGLARVVTRTVEQTGNVPIFEALGFEVTSRCPDEYSESVTGGELTDVSLEMQLHDRRSAMIETLDKAMRSDIVEVLGAAFSEHPLLPPDPSGRTSRRLAAALLDAFADALDLRVFGIRRDGRLDCVAFVFDAAHEPRGAKLVMLLIRMVRIVGWRMSRTMAQVLSEKHEGEERRLELMIIGTREGCQKQGLGRAMIHHVIGYARGRGYDSVVLEVAKETPALNFYMREGFLVEKEISLPIMPLCMLRRSLSEQGAEGDTANRAP